MQHATGNAVGRRLFVPLARYNHARLTVVANMEAGRTIVTVACVGKTECVAPNKHVSHRVMDLFHELRKRRKRGEGKGSGSDEKDLIEAYLLCSSDIHDNISNDRVSGDPLK
jgi:hypothetical protein